ncbi:hypothetical protein CR513_18744, partial [Mucuna pruriens]
MLTLIPPKSKVDGMIHHFHAYSAPYPDSLTRDRALSTPGFQSRQESMSSIRKRYLRIVNNVHSTTNKVGRKIPLITFNDKDFIEVDP